MRRKGKGKPPKVRLTEDALTWFVMEQALYNPEIGPEQGSALIKASLAARKEREQAARRKATKRRG